MMESTPKTPVLLVDNDKWSRETYVVFADDQAIIPEDWIDNAYVDARTQAEYEGEEFTATREQIASEMRADFYSENSDIDEYWPQYHILRAGDNYYRYTEDGMAHFITEADALEAMPPINPGP